MVDKIRKPEVERDKDGCVKDAYGHLAILLGAIKQRGLTTQVGQKVCNEAQACLDAKPAPAKAKAK